jgi:hypothetical protein
MGILTLCKDHYTGNFSFSSDYFAVQKHDGTGEEETDYRTTNLTIARSQTERTILILPWWWPRTCKNLTAISE